MLSEFETRRIEIRQLDYQQLTNPEIVNLAHLKMRLPNSH